MSDAVDPGQYRTSDNLVARANMFQKFGSGPSPWHGWIFDHLLAANLPADARIADIGGGPGWLWKENAARIPTGWQIVHTDLSPGMVTEARANVGRAGSTFEVADAQALPFADASLDALTANHMLYHVPDLPRAVSEFARVLKPDGWLLATTNGREHMAEITELMAAFNRLHDGVLKPWPTLNFTLESGGATLAAKFVDVTLDKRPAGTMRVTEAEALASCITSVIKPDEATTAKLVAFLRDKIAAADGVLPLRTQSGLFVARRP